MIVALLYFYHFIPIGPLVAIPTSFRNVRCYFYFFILFFKISVLNFPFPPFLLIPLRYIYYYVPNARVAAQVEVGDKIGQGGFGVVYKVCHRVAAPAYSM